MEDRPSCTPQLVEDAHCSLSSSEPPLTALPSPIGASPSLITHLDVSRNRIASLPPDLASSLTSLLMLDASRNWLRELPPGLPPSLTSLSLLSNKLRPIDRSMPADVLAPLRHLTRLDLRFNAKLKGSAETSDAIASRLPRGGGRCEVLLTEPHKGEAKPSAATRDATQLRCQLEPLSTPQLRARLAKCFGVATSPDSADRDALLEKVVECYNERRQPPRPTRRVEGAPLGPAGELAYEALLGELRATVFPGEEKRERPKIRAEGYIILQRPAEGVDVAAGAEPSAEDGAEDGAGRDGPADARACERGSMSTKARLALAKLRRHARIWDLAAEIIAEADPQYAARYTAVAVTKRFEGSPHIDTENCAPFYGLGLGEYAGGFICVESEDGMGVYEVDTQRRLGKVDGRYPHWVSPHEGERYSIIYYQTAGDVVPPGPSVFAESVELESWRGRR